MARCDGDGDGCFLRHFVVLCDRGSDPSKWALENLPAGRLDLKSRFVSSSLFLSGNLRHNTTVNLCHPRRARVGEAKGEGGGQDEGRGDEPGGPGNPGALGCVVVDGDAVRGLSPDERTIAAAMRRTCSGVAPSDAGWAHHADETSLHAVLGRLGMCSREPAGPGPPASPTAPLLLQLHEDGVDVLEALAQSEVRPGAGAPGRDVIVVVGDDRGFTDTDEQVLRGCGAVRVSLGKQNLLASHCAVIMHYPLDTHLHVCASRARPWADRIEARRVDGLLRCGRCGGEFVARGGAYSKSQLKKGKARQCRECRESYDASLGRLAEQRRRACGGGVGPAEGGAGEDAPT